MLTFTLGYLGLLVAVYAVAILFEALTMTIAFKLFDPNISGSEFVAFSKRI